MTPEQLKKNLAHHIALLEALITRADDYAHATGRHYGVYGYGEPKNVYETQTLLRQLQAELEIDPDKLEHLVKVHSLDEKGAPE